MRSKKRCLNNFLLLLIFIFLAFISSMLLFHTHNLFGAGDMQFHLKRIAELESSFKHGNLLPSFSFNQFHGSAVMSLYPYLNLVPVVILSYIIKSPIILIYVYFGITTLFSLIISYYSSLSVSKSHKTSLVFSIIYSLSLPFLTYSIYDMALGVNTVIIALPLIIFGFFNLLDKHKWLKFSFGVILVIYSHILSTLMIIGFILLLLIVNYKKIHKSVLLCIYKSLLFILLMTSLTWIPFIKLVISNVGGLSSPGTDPLRGTSFISLFKNSIFDYINFDLGFFAIIGLIIPLIFYKIFYLRFSRYTKQMYWLSILIILVCSNIFPWKITNFSIFKVFKIFQFTWRFYIIPEILLSYIFSVCVTKCINTSNIKQVIIVLSIIIAVSLQILGQKQIIDGDIHAPTFTNQYVSSHKRPLGQFHYYIVNKAGYQTPGRPYYRVNTNAQVKQLLNTNTNFSVSDYYPKASSSKIKYINNDDATYSSTHVIHVKNNGYNQVAFNTIKPVKDLSLPLLYYKGENVRIYVDHHLVNYRINKNSLINIKSLCKGHHELSIQYKPNMFLLIIKYVLFIFGLLWLIFIIVQSTKYKIKRLVYIK